MPGRKVKIVSNGFVGGTKVIDAESGEEISGVQSITWDIDIETGIAQCTLIAIGWPVELESDAEILEEKVSWQSQSRRKQ